LAGRAAATAVTEEGVRPCSPAHRYFRQERVVYGKPAAEAVVEEATASGKECVFSRHQPHRRLSRVEKMGRQGRPKMLAPG